MGVTRSATGGNTVMTDAAGHQHADTYECGVGEVAATNVATGGVRGPVGGLP